MRKKTKIVLTIIAVTIVLVSFIGGQAYAKYMSKVTGNGVAEVANWKFKVNENEEVMQTISLNSTINNITLAKGKIAPGTSGKFQIKLDATGSDAGVLYTIDFANESVKPSNLKFKFNGETYKTLGYLRNTIIGSIYAIQENKEEIVTIEWEWPYETGTTAEEIAQNDALDTKEAKAIDDYTFDVIVTGTQIKPQG